MVQYDNAVGHTKPIGDLIDINWKTASITPPNLISG